MYRVCNSLYAIRGYLTAKSASGLRVARNLITPFNWLSLMFWIHYIKYRLFSSLNNNNPAHMSDCEDLVSKISEGMKKAPLLCIYIQSNEAYLFND